MNHKSILGTVLDTQKTWKKVTCLVHLYRVWDVFLSPFGDVVTKIRSVSDVSSQQLKNKKLKKQTNKKRKILWNKKGPNLHLWRWWNVSLYDKTPFRTPLPSLHTGQLLVTKFSTSLVSYNIPRGTRTKRGHCYRLTVLSVSGEIHRGHTSIKFTLPWSNMETRVIRS